MKISDADNFFFAMLKKVSIYKIAKVKFPYFFYLSTSYIAIYLWSTVKWY